MNDSNQPFACNKHSEPCLNMVFAMLGNPPSTLITNDDKTMAKAIANVLPNATHILCMWHILQKALD